MGYTNYLKIDMNVPAELFTPQLKNDLLKVIEHGKDILGDETGNVNTKPFIDELCIAFNGLDNDSHESCVLPLCKKAVEKFSFCKTARKPYDQYVLACYFVMKMHLKEFCTVGSDGCMDISSANEEVKTAFLLFIELFKPDNMTLDVMCKKP